MTVAELIEALQAVQKLGYDYADVFFTDNVEGVVGDPGATGSLHNVTSLSLGVDLHAISASEAVVWLGQV
jgi:hypothetical protein